MQPAKLPHWPFAPQVCTPLLEHWVAPGVHAEAQAPAVHTLAQGAPVFCQVPLASHVCGCWPLHCSAPGVQTPVHVAAAEPASPEDWPPLQTYGHVAPCACHAPVESHVCGSLLLQRVRPGLHAPEHAPATHV